MPAPSDHPPAEPSPRPRIPPSSLDRRILALAWPSLGALVAEPLFILVDSAVVGRLGTAPLAGLSLASTVLLTVVGLCVFLAYATTGAVARSIGAGRQRQALTAGIDGLWLACALGLALGAALWLTAPWIVHMLGATEDVLPQAVAYLRWSAPGLPGMLLVLAATGVLRGFQDARTPLIVAVAGAISNAVANVVVVLGLGTGIAGSAAGTAATQTAMGLVLSACVARRARDAAITMRPAPGGIWMAIRTGTPLFVRTLSLRIAILVTVYVATGLGTVTLAGHQIVNSLWGLAAFALDALAIAAQALIGHDLGAGHIQRVQETLRRTLRWGVGAGAVLGVLMASASAWIAPLFTADPQVRTAIGWGLLACGALLPLAGWVFVLDGVLIGAGDGRFLARAGIATLLVYLPVAWAVRTWAPHGPQGLAWLWLGFGLFMAARAVTTGRRARTTAWMVTGT